MRLFLTAGIIFLSFTLFAAPYYSEHKEGNTTYIFYGNIEEEDISTVRKLESKFMASRDSRWHFQNELEGLGVEVESIENDDEKRLQLPLEVKKHDLPEGVTGCN